MSYLQDTKHWQLYVHNLSQRTVVDSLHPSTTSVTDLAPHNQQLQSLHLKQQLPPLLPIHHQPRLGFSLKHCLAIVPLLLLPYTTTTQALSVTTVQVINGSAPYLTFDNGVTKVTTAEGLLWITLSDGTLVTPANNSSASTPIVLPKAGETLADVQMLVPATTDSIALSDLISAPYNYWGDDDGDGQGTNGVTATGNLSVSITDKDDQAVSRSASLDICQAPYKVKLTSTAGSLTTQYGIPSSSSFSGGTTTYYINPKAPPKICYARSNMQFSNMNGISDADPINIFNKEKGFLVQSIEPSSYYRNFPTTGSNEMYFHLLIGGIDPRTLTWPAVTKGGITATIDSEKGDFPSSVRITLTGPDATMPDRWVPEPTSIDTPSLPQAFELVGYDSSHTEVLKYGFVLKHWFVAHSTWVSYASHLLWCSRLGGYRLAQIKDLTNAKCGVDINFPCINGIDGAAPASSGNHYQRNIGAGFNTEWGYMFPYSSITWSSDPYITSDCYGSKCFVVDSYFGKVIKDIETNMSQGAAICVYP